MLEKIQNTILLVLLIVALGLFFANRDWSIIVFFITMLFSSYLLITRKQFKK